MQASMVSQKSHVDLLALPKAEKLALGAEILSSKKGRRKVATKAEGEREDLFRPIGCPVDRGEMCI